MKTSEVRKEFVNLFEGLAQKYSRHQIWSDFIIMSACAIVNASMIWNNSEKNRFYLERTDYLEFNINSKVN